MSTEIIRKLKKEIKFLVCILIILFHVIVHLVWEKKRK